GCHEDHAALTGELIPILEIRAPRIAVALVVEINAAALTAPTSATVVETSPHSRPPAPTGATLPLRL
ncbi:MAG: hypothetical protein ABJC89_21765, partial [Acidobacteriota bacterium]